MTGQAFPEIARGAQNEFQGFVTAIGLRQDLISDLDNETEKSFGWESVQSENRLSIQIDQGLLQTDVLLLGQQIEQPLKIAQRVHGFDKTIPVIIMTPARDYDELRRSIMFAPLLGNVITPWSLDETSSLADAIRRAVERHRQRRQYLDTIATVQPKFGNLSFSQPELGHYLGRLLEQAPIGVVSLDAGGIVLGINRQAGRILGQEERQVLDTPLEQYFDELSGKRLSNLLKRSAVGQKFGMTPEVLHSVARKSQVRYLEATASRISYRAEQRGFMVILQDVTQRELAELRRRHTEGHMRMLSGALEQAGDAVMITDSNRVIEYVNPAFEQLTGYSPSEVVGRAPYFLRSGIQDQNFFEELWGKVSSGGVFRGVLINRRKDGTIYHEEKTITPLRDNDGEISHYISTGRDISERLEAEDNTRRHQAESAHIARLSTLGEMASGIAHEVNQPLCAITTYAQTCLRVLNSGNLSPDKLTYGLDQVVRQADLASQIFRRLRNFARKGENSNQQVNLTKVVKEVKNMIGAELERSQISLKQATSGPTPIVWADPVQIEQVLLNLLRNSRDAVMDLPLNRREITLEVHSDSTDGVKVSVIDKGPGVPGNISNNLFEPFFTTKANGLGVGLGISQTIIESHGGKLFLESTQSSGTKFSFTLPIGEFVTRFNEPKFIEA